MNTEKGASKSDPVVAVRCRGDGLECSSVSHAADRHIPSVGEFGPDCGCTFSLNWFPSCACMGDHAFVRCSLLAAAARLIPVVATLIAIAAPGGARATGEAGWEQSGTATWYGGRHHGRRTSSGEAFDQNAMTAAHPSLPMGSRVRVTLQDTGESVVVRITDRQPYHGGRRIIDLSRGAAARIGLLARGTGRVTLRHAGVSDQYQLFAAEEVEVAEAPEEAGAGSAADFEGAANPRRRGRLHTRHARPAVAEARPCCRAPSAVPVRYSAPRRAALRRS